VFMIISRRSLSVLGISFGAFVRSFAIPLISTIGMILGISMLDYVVGAGLAPPLKLIIYIISGALLYSIFIMLVKRDYFFEAWGIIRNKK